MATDIVEKAGSWQKLLTSNDSSAAFVARAPTGTKPTVSPDGNAIVMPGSTDGTGGQIASTLKLMFFGAGADNTTYSIRVIGWVRVNGTWIPEPICAADVILGGIVGAATLALLAADRLADTITVTSGIGVVRSLATADACPAVLEVGSGGCALITVEFDMVAATSGNALWSVY